MWHVQILMNAFTVNPSTGANDRSAGFSDGWYQESRGGFGLTTNDMVVMNRRAALLPPTSSIVGARVAELDANGKSKGRSRPTRLSLSGGAGLDCDDPRMCLQYSCYGFQKSNELQLYIQNVPDARIEKGSYKPNTDWQTKIRSYMTALTEAGYKFLGFDQDQTKYGVETISNAGAIVTTNPHVFTEGQYIRILRTTPTTRTKFRTDPDGYLVTAAPDAFHLTVQGWTFGECKGGQICKWEKVLCDPTLTDNDIATPQVATRKVGRPFFQYRGRVSNRV